MKSYYKQVIRSDEEYVVFLNTCGEFESYVPSGKPLKNSSEAKYYCNLISLKWPIKYPCVATFTNKKVEEDDVGFGFYYKTEVSFIYEEDLKKELKETQKELKELKGK